MSFVVVAPEMIHMAAQDLAGIRSELVEVITAVAAPTTGMTPAAGDEVSVAIATTFGNFGRQFQSLSAQAQAFHAEFVNVINASASTYLSTEIANAEQTLVNVANAPTRVILGLGGGQGLGGVAAGGSTPAAGGLLGGLLGALTGTGTGGNGALPGLLGGLTGSNGLRGGLLGSSGLLGGLLGSSGLLGDLPGSSGLLGGFLGGLTGGAGLVGALGNLGSLSSVLGSLLPGLPNLLGGLGNTLTGLKNSLLPGLLHITIGDAGPYLSGIAGPYQALFYNTWNNLQNLGATWLADPFPFLRQFIANQMGYAQTVATALENAAQSVDAHLAALPAAFQAASQAFSAGSYAAGLTDVETGLQNVFSGIGPNLTPISSIPGHIAHNVADIVHLTTNPNITPHLDVSLLNGGLMPSVSVTLNNVGLPAVFGAALLGPPVNMLEAAGSSAAAFTAALQAGNSPGAIAALVDAPAVIANGFLNGQAALHGQATIPAALSLSNITGSPVAVNVSVVGNLPLDGLLVSPGYSYTATVLISTSPNGIGVGPVVLDIGVGDTPFSGLLPFLVNDAPEQLAQAIGAAAPPP